MKIALLVAPLLAVLTFATVARADEAPISPALRAVVEGLSGKPATDIPLISKYIVDNPKDGNAYAIRCSMRTEVARTFEDAQNAFADCKAALALSPQSGLVHATVADVLYDSGDIKSSLAEYDKAIALGASDDLYWRRCDARRRVGDLDGALADCDRQLQLTPHAFPALYSHGVVDDARGDYAAAVDHLTAALASRPKQINALYWRGIAYENLKQYANAEADYSQCLTLGDQSGDTSYHLGLVKMALGKNRDAMEQFATAMVQYTLAHDTKRAEQMRDLAVQAASRLTPSPSPSPSPTP